MAAVLVAAIGLTAGCSPSPDRSGAPPPSTAAVRIEADPAAATPDPDRLPPPPAVRHPATVSGTAPLPIDDVPAVIVLEPTQRYAHPPPAERPMMDQIAGRFTPAAIVVRTGLAADFRNDDPTLHNVRVRERGHAADDLAFNVALEQGVTYDYVFRKDSAWDVRCDVHQNMYGLVVSTSSPYWAVAAADGAFEVSGVAPGRYTAIVYTSRDRSEQAIDVGEGQHLTLALP